jgi:hypothetical protein
MHSIQASIELSRRSSALFAHWLDCAKDCKLAAFIACVLPEAGCSVLGFDGTGLGGGGGHSGNTHCSGDVDDGIADRCPMDRTLHTIVEVARGASAIG